MKIVDVPWGGRYGRGTGSFEDWIERLGSNPPARVAAAAAEIDLDESGDENKKKPGGGLGDGEKRADSSGVEKRG
ncbi:MAG: hypothetical protein LBR53_01095 [Deltaproteobacteria bacterium]|nr:hypothetical protein [Deltaproteobacteria bacterium]